MKILFVPCHYIFDANSGSEPSWSYYIANKMSSFAEIMVVTGFQKKSENGVVLDTKPYKVVELQPTKKVIDMSFKNALIFNWQYFGKTRENFRAVDLVHHLLPFAIGSTYNLQALLGFGKTKFIIGPLQTPLEYPDLDTNPKDFRNAKKTFDPIKLILPFVRPILSFLSNQTLKKADGIVVINQKVKNILLSRGIPENKIKIIPPGIDLTKFQFLPKKEIPKTFEIKNSPTETFEILSVGYLLQRKGLDLVIKALSELAKMNLSTQINLNILGDGPQLNNLQKMVADFGLKNVNFLGFVENSKVSQFYQQADVFVSMSRGESWGQMYLEAMACGLPIITTENTGSLEIIENGETGFLVPKESVESLVEKILFLVNNPTKKIEIAKKARQIIEEKYDWNKISEQYLDYYNQVLANK